MRLVVAGAFHTAGTAVASNIALFDPVAGTWAPLGAGTNGSIGDVVVLPNGDLAVAGGFTSAGGVPGTTGVAGYDGTSWYSMGGGIGNYGNSLAVVGGNLYVGGLIQFGGPTAYSLAMWNGASWLTPTPGVSLGSILSLVALGGQLYGIDVDPLNPIIGRVIRIDAALNSVTVLAAAVGFQVLAEQGGALVVGGSFLNVPTSSGPASFLARLPVVGGGLLPIPIAALAVGPGAVITSLTTLATGAVLVGGPFGIAAGGGVALLPAIGPIAALGAGVVGTAASGAVLPGGTSIFIGGAFDGVGAIPAAAGGFAEWTGAVWTTFGTNAGLFGDGDGTQFPPNLGAVSVDALRDWSGTPVVGGRFAQAAGVPAGNIATFGGTWAPMGAGFDNQVLALAVRRDGVLFAGGRFLASGTTAVSLIAEWTGAAWVPLGTGITGPGLSAVTALAAAPNGDIIAGGSFTTAGGVPTNNVALWDGAAWTSLGGGILGLVSALAVPSDGQIFAGGNFLIGGAPASLATWDGTNWRALGSFDGPVTALHVEANGNLLVGGAFTTEGTTVVNGIARWDGVSFTGLGTGVSGGFGTVVNAITTTVTGDVIVGGNFTTAGSASALNIARWNGTAWSGFGLGTDDRVIALERFDDLTVGVGGRFGRAGTAVSCRFATITSTCLPVVTSTTAAGCQTLTASNLPLIGTTFRATATGMLPQSIALGVRGLTPASVPLSSLFPGIGATCSLLASADLLDVYLPVGGVVQTQIVIPNTALLIGQTLRHQVIDLVFNSAGAISAATGTNALSLTFGAF